MCCAWIAWRLLLLRYAPNLCTSLCNHRQIGSKTDLRCPCFGDGCLAAWSAGAIRDTLPTLDPSIGTKLDHQLNRNLSIAYVEASPFLVFCKGTDCDAIVSWNGVDGGVKCTSCHEESCPRCSLPPHMPLSCSQLIGWAEIGGFVPSADNVRDGC